MIRTGYYINNRIKEIEREIVRVKESFEVKCKDKVFNLKIEKGIPLSTRFHPHTSPFYSIAEKMDVGDSIEFPDHASAQRLVRIFRRLNIGYSCRKTQNKHFRVYKI